MTPLVFLLAFAPAEQDPEQAAAELQTTIDNAMDGDRQAVIAQLTLALDSNTRHPAQATDAGPSDAVLEAYVILVRLHLAEKNPDAAEAAMDELIRIARDRTPPVRRFGGEVTKLYDTRKEALAASATLAVSCELECEVVINERLVEGGTEQLPLGTYRVWINATELDVGWEYQEVELTAAGGTVDVTYADPTPPPEPEPVVAEPEPLPEPEPEPKRLLPRNAEIGGLAVGVGLVIAGAVLLSFNNKCTLSRELATAETSPEICGDVYRTLGGAAAMLGIGGGVLLVSGVMLTVDEVRVGKAKGREVMLSVSMKF